MGCRWTCRRAIGGACWSTSVTWCGRRAAARDVVWAPCGGARGRRVVWAQGGAGGASVLHQGHQGRRHANWHLQQGRSSLLPPTHTTCCHHRLHWAGTLPPSSSQFTPHPTPSLSLINPPSEPPSSRPSPPVRSQARRRRAGAADRHGRGRRGNAVIAKCKVDDICSFTSCRAPVRERSRQLSSAQTPTLISPCPPKGTQQ